MRQNEFILKVISIKDLPEPERLNYDNHLLVVEVWDIPGNFIIDEKITEFYPQLKKIGLEEYSEGTMVYSNFLIIEDLKQLLDKWGFALYGSDKHFTLKAGNEIECKIKPKYDLEIEERKGEIEELKEKLEQAINKEEYELAAKIRDEIKSKENEIR